MESEQHVQHRQLRHGVARLIGLGALLAVLGCGATAADDGYSLALRLVPGQVVAYDGTYLLWVPTGNNGKGLVLASAKYGLVLRTEAVDEGWAVIRGEYDRFEGKLRSATTAGESVSPVGQTFKCRVAPDGRVEALPGGPWPPSWGALLAAWAGWPAEPVKVGDAWRGESRTDLTGGGRIEFTRQYRFCAVESDAALSLALLDYTEQGSVSSVTVSLPDGQAVLDGKLLGVGQVRLDLSLGLVAEAASISTLTGMLSRRGPPANTLGQVRLETQVTVNVRRPAPP